MAPRSRSRSRSRPSCRLPADSTSTCGGLSASPSPPYVITVGEHLRRPGDDYNTRPLSVFLVQERLLKKVCAAENIMRVHSWKVYS
ncbi:hypothetical protein PAAG_07521 [Paracoccidioides lutzii Pb01]|uniref:Uncharacterized protein n=1 Tax=Paracoccidioides lutzii (strain ATCC MYA-826 / Pb01) TaxID=502779 RepID=C1H9T0_PARBA|nr:hypothetical protein PAAG_07521 [Paracoccidioides lutzii Pb01]EEH37103.1 hypothetical protein PAAG_07521 [Paracoccidioides lutzii Pb01]